MIFKCDCKTESFDLAVGQTATCTRGPRKAVKGDQVVLVPASMFVVVVREDDGTPEMKKTN